METVFRTDTGKVRTHNEDSGGIFQTEYGILAAVADGMGGHRAGDIASQMAVTYVKDQWERLSATLKPVAAEKWLKQTINEANERLYTYAEEHPECKGMGTTLVIALCTENYITMAHIGDSRIYLFTKTGLSLQTEDHSLVNELIKNGQLSEEEAEMHPRKHVLLRALGTEKRVEADIQTLHWEKGDIVFLCTDGLTNKVMDDMIEEVVSSDQAIETKADELIQLANQAGGEDNITIAMVKNVCSGDRKRDDNE